MNFNSHRRRTGLILGLVLGTGYSLTANLINHLKLPDIPLYTPPPGVFGLTVITALMFGVLGLLAAWLEESLPSILLSGLAGSVISSIWILINQTNKTATLSILVLVFLPRIFFYLPFGAMVRWLIYKLDQPTSRPIAPVRRLVPVFLAFIFMIFIGSFNLLPKETRTSLIRMEALLQKGRTLKPPPVKTCPSRCNPCLDSFKTPTANIVTSLAQIPMSCQYSVPRPSMAKWNPSSLSNIKMVFALVVYSPRRIFNQRVSTFSGT